MQLAAVATALAALWLLAELWFSFAWVSAAWQMWALAAWLTLLHVSPHAGKEAQAPEPQT
jgi:hypothetical protein